MNNAQHKTGLNEALTESSEARFQFERLRIPVVQAPMAGAGITTPELVIAACNSGVLGSLAASYCTPAQLELDVSQVRKCTQRQFGINLFAPTNDPRRPTDGREVLHRLKKWHSRFGLAAPEIPETAAEHFDILMETIISLKPAVVSSTFGLFPDAVICRLRSAGAFLMGTATTVAEAVRVEQAGYDAVIVQGSESGGHRGGFDPVGDSGMIGLVALIPQVVDAVNIPVVATGGIMDGRGIAAAICLGAVAVQMGTAFLVTTECGAAPCYKEKILGTLDKATVMTSAFSGRRARAIPNLFTRDMEDIRNLLPYPWQNALTRPLRSAAMKAHDPEALSLWAGQGIGMAKAQPVHMLVNSLTIEMGQALRKAHLSCSMSTQG